MSSAEVRQHVAAHELTLICAELFNKDLLSIRPSHTMHAIDKKFKVITLQKCFNHFEVKKLLH